MSGDALDVLNAVNITGAPDAVATTPQGTITIDPVDGEPITISGGTIFDGTYATDIDGSSAWNALIAGGGFWLVAPTLTDDGTPEVGETLGGSNGLFFYDNTKGVPTLTSTTNGTSVVDLTTPGTPTVLVDAADAGSTLTRAERWTYGDASFSEAVSNGVAIPAPASGAASVQQSDFFVDTAVTKEITVLSGANRRLLVVMGFEPRDRNLTLADIADVTITVGGDALTMHFLAGKLFDAGVAVGSMDETALAAFVAANGAGPHAVDFTSTDTLLRATFEVFQLVDANQATALGSSSRQGSYTATFSNKNLADTADYADTLVITSVVWANDAGTLTVGGTGTQLSASTTTFLSYSSATETVSVLGQAWNHNHQNTTSRENAEVELQIPPV